MEQEYEMFTNDTINHEDRISNEMQLSSNISIVFYVMQCLLFLPDLYVNTLVLRMAMREAVILSLELKLNSVFNMISSIYNLVFMGLPPIFRWLVNVCLNHTYPNCFLLVNKIFPWFTNFSAKCQTFTI